jgi:hypothetical protein
MTPPLDPSTYFSQEVFSYEVLEKISVAEISELKKYRSINHSWKDGFDMLLSGLWAQLRKTLPKEKVDISTEIKRIDTICPEMLAINKFKALEYYFRTRFLDFGVSLPSGPICIARFRALQDKLDEIKESSKTVWNGVLRSVILNIDPPLANVPPVHADAKEVQKFLFDPANHAALELALF